MMPDRGAARGTDVEPSRTRVLVVDDEPMMGTTLRVMLAEKHEVVVTHSARQAMELLECDGRFDAILCDLMLPGVSGMDLYGWLKENMPHLAEATVFMTGGAYTPEAHEFLEQQGSRRIEKPFGMDELVRAVDAVIHRRS
jgi:DNA-binding response OmpR family regulator